MYYWVFVCFFYEFGKPRIAQFEFPLYAENIVRLDVGVPPVFVRYIARKYARLHTHDIPELPHL